MSAPWFSAPVPALQDFPTAAPGLSFAVRWVGGPDGQAAPEGSGERHGATPDRVTRDRAHHNPDRPHPLAGTGKLFMAVAVAQLAEREPGLLADRVTIRGDHRAAARSGTLRRMTGDLQLSVSDAMALTVGTGDGACAAALLEHLRDGGVEVLAEARRMAAGLGLEATTFTALETATDQDGGHPGESWGEGLLGSTTPADLCAVLSGLVRSATPATDPAAGPSGAPGTEGSAPLDSRTATRVLGWMDKAFEPAGLASALPGFGPRTIPHRTVSGVELLAPARASGCASVLILPAGAGTQTPATCVAAYASPGAGTPGGPGTSLGRLGLAVAGPVSPMGGVSRG